MTRGVKLGKGKVPQKSIPKDLAVLKNLPKKVKVGEFYKIKTRPDKSSNKRGKNLGCRLVTFKAMKESGMGKFRIAKNEPCPKKE